MPESTTPLPADLDTPGAVEALVRRYRANETALQDAILLGDGFDVDTYRLLKQQMIDSWKAYNGGDAAELHEMAMGDEPCTGS